MSEEKKIKTESEIRYRLAKIRLDRALAIRKMRDTEKHTIAYQKLELEANVLWAFAQTLHWVLGEEITEETIKKSL